MIKAMPLVPLVEERAQYCMIETMHVIFTAGGSHSEFNNIVHAGRAHMTDYILHLFYIHHLKIGGMIKAMPLVPLVEERAQYCMIETMHVILTAGDSREWYWN